MNEDEMLCYYISDLIAEELIKQYRKQQRLNKDTNNNQANSNRETKALGEKQDELECNTISTKAFKEKQDKMKCGTIPATALADLMAVFSFGAEKHGRNSWIDYPVENYIDALSRHYVSVLENLESVDKESGLPHLAHLAANALIITAIINNRKNKNVSDIIYNKK